MPREAYFAIAAEAKKDGIEFEGHVPDAIRASEAVAAGQKTFEHLIGIFEASSPDEDKYLKGDYFVGTKSVGMFLKTYDPGAREEDYRSGGDTPCVAVSDAVLGAWAMADRRYRLQERSGHWICGQELGGDAVACGAEEHYEVAGQGPVAGAEGVCAA